MRKPGYSVMFSNRIGLWLWAESAPMSSMLTGLVMTLTTSRLRSR